MATQCGLNNAVRVVKPHRQQFVSSSVYYGYVPLQNEDEAARSGSLEAGMDVDVDGQQQCQVREILEEPQCLGQRKRACGHDELPNYVPRLKRFREALRGILIKYFLSHNLEAHHAKENDKVLEATIDKLSGFNFRGSGKKRVFHGAGNCLWAEDHGLAKVYHDPSLLCLSPAANFDMACQTSMMTGNLKFQSSTLSKNINTRCQELEEMLLLTHGCSSYHHYRQIQLNQGSDTEEAEF